MTPELLLGGNHRRRCGLKNWLTLSAGVLFLALLNPTPAAHAQGTPTLTSVTPANGATGVAVDGTLVFVFSTPMGVDVSFIPSVPPFVVGNLEFTPSGSIAAVEFQWSDDGRTLTCQPVSEMPVNTTITWKLNPAGAMFPITSSGGVALATVSGSFTTGAGGGGGTGPKLVSSSPADGATAVPVTTAVVFVFDQAMQKNTALGGFPPTVPGAIAWGGTGVTATKFSYSWSTDGMTLTCDYSGDLPGNTEIAWTQNPGTLIQLESEAGDPLPSGTYAGSFTTGQGSGGGEDCDPSGVPATWGAYTLSKSSSYQQTSTADPVPVAESPFAFSVLANGPQAGPAATAGSLTLPNNTSQTLQALFGFLTFSDTPATDAALDAAYPAGNYTLRFTQTGQPERVIPMTMPAASVPVPKIANFAAAQAVNAAQGFTLSWNAFTGAGASDYLSLTITDGLGNLLFQAPNPCVPRELPVTATSIVIPANTLETNKSYSAMLAFGRTFYSSTNAVPEMAGFGGVSRSTEFTINTGTGGGAADPARFTGYRLLPNGNPQMNLTGTAAHAYTIQRTSSLVTPAWSNAGTVTMDGAGAAVFEDTAAGKTFPLFYRAVAN